MKSPIQMPLKSILTYLCPLLLIVASNAKAANQYFDVNGVTAGYGTVDGGSYSWDDPNWATVTGGTSATGNWVAGNFARFLGTGSYTCIVNNAESNAGLVQVGAAGSMLTINAGGSGSLDVVPSGTLTGGLPAQGFFCQGGQFLVINAPITGTGAINLGLFSGTGNIFLYGNNTYSGGTALSTSSYLINFNNNNSFGTGPINLVGTTFAPLLSQGGTTITLANNWTNTAASGVNFASAANTPVVCTGPWSLLTFNLNIRNNGNSTAPLTLSGPISGSGGTLNFSANNSGTVTLSGANTYTGPTTLGGSGSSSVTLKVASLNKVSGGSPSSNLGAPTTVANGTISIGNTAVTSILVYTGPGETTDRVLNLAGTSGGATIQADGTGPVSFTSPNTATGVGNKTLTLQGSNTGANTIAGAIVNSAGGLTAVAKAQAGTWVITGTNTYTGGTTVNGGTLEIGATGKIAGSVTNNSGTLRLDSATNLGASATLSVVSSSSVNLNYAGTQVLNGLVIDGAIFTSGTWGSPTSGAANTSSIFTGNGILSVLGAPVIVQQPSPIVAFPDTANQTFSVAVTGDPSFTYHWKLNGTNIAGATDSSYTIPVVEATDAGTYSVAITNAFGFTNSVGATLTVLATNDYVNIVRSDSPISYWRLDETNGTLAYDAIGGNVGKYVNATINSHPGYSLTDPDSCVALPANGSAGRGYVQVTNVSPFSFLGAPAFSLEAWANFTNLTGVQRIFSTLNLTSPNGWAFGINGSTGTRFTAGAVIDADQALATALVPGIWYHFVCTCDGSAYHFYVNGQENGTGRPVGSSTGSTAPLQFGANPNGYTNNTAGDPLSEQVKGRIDEVAIYNYTLSPTQVTNHYAARYGTLASPIVSAPVASPGTNYQSLSIAIQAVAAGQALSYQWFKAPSTLLAGQTGDTLTLSPLQLTDTGSYHVTVSNPVGTNTSPDVAITVLPIPTNATVLNLTNNLVVHLPFDSDYLDISGRNNNGTNVGATTIINTGIIGTNALHYSSDSGSSSYNYVKLGVRPDLQFGATTNFAVSFWIRQPMGSTFTNLPFFTDAIGSTGHGGYAFAPYQTASTAGGWILSIGSMSSPSQFTSFPDQDMLNDGNWHHVVHSADRAANVTTYIDGQQVDSQSIVFVGDINTTNAATIGQDPTGTYPVTASADMDDFAVWTRTLTPLEVSGIFLAGATNGVSFAPAVVAAPIVPVALTVKIVSGQVQISWTGTGGALQASGNVTGTYTNVPSATSPYTVPGPLGPQLFYRLKY